MRRLLGHRPTPALVVSIVALIMAASGTAFAVGGSNPTLVRGSFTVASHTSGHKYAHCPSGMRATGGGVGALAAGGAADRILQSGPTDSSKHFVNTGTGTAPVYWYGRYLNGGSAQETAYVWVLCD
jgi:hypothetical protein